MASRVMTRTRHEEIANEIARRAEAHRADRYLFVDYYRIRHRLAFRLPIRELERPKISVKGFNGDYPWDIWLSWTFEERLCCLLLDGGMNQNALSRTAAAADIEALCEWPTYIRAREQSGRSYLSFAHFVRTMCFALEVSWLTSHLRSKVEAALERAIDEMLPWSDRLHGGFTDRKALIETSEPHKHLHNITLIATLAIARAARLIGHSAATKLHRRVKILVGALLTLRWRGVTEGVSYDGYVLDFVADWLKSADLAEREVFLSHPRFSDTLMQAHGLAVPGDMRLIAELGDVEPLQMPFHACAQAKLHRFNDDPEREWYLSLYGIGTLRSDALAALTSCEAGSSATQPSVGSIDASYALVLRTGWESSDVAVAVGASKSPMGHVHCDNGSLLIGTAGRWIVGDAGYQQYLATAEREFTTGPSAHNAPVINGCAQDKKKLADRRTGEAPNGIRYIHLDITPSYPATVRAQRVMRTVWLLGRDHVVVRDQVELSAPQTVSFTWHAHAECAWSAEKGAFGIHAPDGAKPLFISSPGLVFDQADIKRIRGSRGQLSLCVEFPPLIACKTSVWWVFSFGQPETVHLKNSALVVGSFRIDPADIVAGTAES